MCRNNVRDNPPDVTRGGAALRDCRLIPRQLGLVGISLTVSGLGDFGMDDEELDVTTDVDEEILIVEPERVRTTVVSTEARRRLEDRLEKRRLERLIRDYDFDLA